MTGASFNFGALSSAVEDGMLGVGISGSAADGALSWARSC